MVAPQSPPHNMLNNAAEVSAEQENLAGRVARLISYGPLRLHGMQLPRSARTGKLTQKRNAVQALQRA